MGIGVVSSWMKRWGLVRMVLLVGTMVVSRSGGGAIVCIYF